MTDDGGGSCGPQAHALVDHGIEMLARCHCREVEWVNVFDLVVNEFLVFRVPGEGVEQECESWGCGIAMRRSEYLQKSSSGSPILEHLHTFLQQPR